MKTLEKFNAEQLEIVNNAVGMAEELVSNHLSGKFDNSYKVWTFYTFQKWFKKHMDL